MRNNDSSLEASIRFSGFLSRLILITVLGNYFQSILQLRQLNDRLTNLLKDIQPVRFRTNRDSKLVGWAPRLPRVLTSLLSSEPLFTSVLWKLPLYSYSTCLGFSGEFLHILIFFFLFSRLSLANPSVSVTSLALGTHLWLGLGLQGCLSPPLPSALV